MNKDVVPSLSFLNLVILLVLFQNIDLMHPSSLLLVTLKLLVKFISTEVVSHSNILELHLLLLLVYLLLYLLMLI
jgi:hypothetical protein